MPARFHCARLCSTSPIARRSWRARRAKHWTVLLTWMPSNSHRSRLKRFSARTEEFYKQRYCGDCVLNPCSLNGPGALELRSVHQPASCGVQGVAAMHGAAIVPPYQIADAPILTPREFLLRRMRPEKVQEAFALRDRKADDIGIDPASKEQRLATGFRMGADDRLARSGHLSRLRPQCLHLVSRFVRREQE